MFVEYFPFTVLCVIFCEIEIFASEEKLMHKGIFMETKKKY